MTHHVVAASESPGWQHLPAPGHPVGINSAGPGHIRAVPLPGTRALGDKESRGSPGSEKGRFPWTLSLIH